MPIYGLALSAYLRYNNIYQRGFMNVVIYSEDMEPITVLDLPMQVLDKAATEGQVQLRVRAKNTRYREDQTCVLKYVELLTRDGHFVSALTTEDEVAAMLAKPGWLPGQRGQLNYYLNKIKNLIGQRRD